MNGNELVSKDLKYIWHPYTQMKDCETLPPIPVSRAEGVKLYDYAGNYYYDTISSWWCNVHGHNNPVIKKAIKDQLDSLEHVHFAGFTHAPAVELAERLIKISPENISKVFFSDNGSTSVEVALKMSFQYWYNSGSPNKKRFVSFDMSYHGDTAGAMSVGGVDLFNEKFRPLLSPSYKIPAPYCYRCPQGQKKGECSYECMNALESALKADSDEIAGFIMEPLMLGAGGILIYPAGCLKMAREITEKYNVHLILDEVATGFGRTGKMFACEHANVEPDIMCVSKGITSGYLPLSATMTTEKIYDSFYGDYSEFKTFYHGHTYTANPLACAAGIASIDLFEEEGTLENVKQINKALRSFLDEISDVSFVGDTRSIGAIGAFELVKDKLTKEPFPMEDRIGMEFYKKGLEKNLVLRPLGNVVYFFLPLCMKQDELSEVFQRALEVVDSYESLVGSS